MATKAPTTATTPTVAVRTAYGEHTTVTKSGQILVILRSEDFATIRTALDHAANTAGAKVGAASERLAKSLTAAMKDSIERRI